MEPNAPPLKPLVPKPPGYRDPTAPPPVRQPLPVRRKPVHLPPSLQKPKRSSCCRICCCSFCLFLLILTFVTLISAGIFYLWFDPRFPIFHLQSIRTNRFNVTVKSDGSYLSAETAIRLEVRNPNGKLTYHYGGSNWEVTVGEDKDTDIGSARLDGFNQGRKNTTSLRVVSKVSGLAVDDGVGSRLKARYRTKALIINVDVKTTVAVGLYSYLLGSVPIEIQCGGVTLKRLQSGEMPKCTINFLRW
ncbi:hypothetical protein ACFE04_019213 [Oxalis oulophora]